MRQMCRLRFLQYQAYCNPFDSLHCVSAFNKCLRGYTNLGLEVSYRKAVLAHAQGYRLMALGGINNDFKKKFISISRLEPLYGYEIWREATFLTKTPHGYTHAFFY